TRRSTSASAKVLSGQSLAGQSLRTRQGLSPNGDCPLNGYKIRERFRDRPLRGQSLRPSPPFVLRVSLFRECGQALLRVLRSEGEVERPAFGLEARVQ